MQKLAIALALSLTPALLAQNGLIVTVAGNGVTGTAGVGGPAIGAALSGSAICVDGADNFYVADRANNRVVKVDAVTGVLTLVAGNGVASSAGDSGPATQASLNAPSGVAVDAAGNLFIAEFIGNRVRRVDSATGIITTIAGNGAGAWAGDGGPAVNGSLNLPMGLALDVAGNLYIADAGNYRIRKVETATGILTTIAGAGVFGHSPDGTPAVSASLSVPMAVSFDRQGDLLITETYGYAIRRVSGATGLLSTVAGNGNTDFNGDGQPAASAALGYLVSAAAADAAGNLYFADGTGRVRRVDAASGIISTVAGSGAGAHGMTSSSGSGSGGGPTTCAAGLGDNGPATIATLDGAYSVALTSTGKLLIPDFLDCRVRAVQLPSPLLYTNTGLNMAGQTLTATVTPIGGAAIPTGTVQFMDNLGYGPPLPLSSATLSSGSATLDVGSLSAGGHQVMAIYTGDSTYNGSGSTTLSVTGSGKATPSIGTNVPYPVLVSTAITLNITVVGSRGQPTGSVQMWEGNTLLASLTLVNGGGPFSYSSATPGVHQITLQYSGDSNYIPLSWTFPVTVLVPGTLSLSANANPAGAGADVTFTGTIAPSTATGRVSFFDGGMLLGTSSLSLGSASLTVSTLAGGPHSITATYAGDFVVAPATSNVLTEIINGTGTTLTLSTSGSPSTWGQGVTFNASITPASAPGTVIFYDGAAQVGSATLNAGSAQFTTTQLAAGSHTITAVYSANAGYGASTSPALTQTVNKASTSAALTSSLNPATVGLSVVLTATLSPSAATGSVQFLDGATVLGTASISGGAASFTTAGLTAGSHSITVAYPGDANCNAVTSAVLTQTISKVSTTTTLSTNTATSIFGQSVLLTTSVTPAAATGTVDLMDGATVLVTLPVNGPISVLNTNTLAAGAHSLTAVFSGDATYAGSTSAPVTVTVSKTDTTSALTSSANPSASGQQVVFSAALSPTRCTGNVQFLDGATVLGTVATVFGTASFTTAGLTPGSHSITVAYSGDANCNAVTSAVLTQTVSKAPTTTTISTNTATSIFGQSVLLTTSVAPAAATGTVDLMDGATVLVTLPVNGPISVLNTNTLAAGAHSLTAVFSGDATYAGSTSAPVTVTVSKTDTTSALTSSANPSASGQQVVFSAALSPTRCTGNVQFLDGSTVLGTVATVFGTASFTTAGLTPGSHSITLLYGGDANCNAVTSTVLTQTVSKVPTTTALSANSGAIVFGQSVSLTASVTPASATGPVQFLDGATVIGTLTLSNGSATLTATNLPVGAHAFTAVYAGDASNGGSSSAAMTVTVAKAAASVTVASSLNPSIAGQTVTFGATVSPAAATGSVQFLDGGTVIGTMVLNGGSAMMSTTGLAAGSHSITAVYTGNDGYNGATSGPLTQTVSAMTTTSLLTNRTTAVSGQTVTFAASVSPVAATGNVQFLDGGTVIGTVALSGGPAILSVSNLAVGNHSVVASYGGAAGYAASSSAAVGVTITAGPPAAPSSLTASAVSSSQINLSWVASATPGVSYNVYAAASSGFAPAAANRIASGITTASYAHTGLPASTTVYYLVTAQNANGESAVSNQAGATTQAPAISCQVVYTVTSQWNVGFGTTMAIKNTGSTPIDGWQLTWTWAGNQQITQAWNSTYTQSGANVTLKNEAWNPAMAPGATINGLGFNASYSGSNPRPAAFYLNGTLCQ